MIRTLIGLIFVALLNGCAYPSAQAYRAPLAQTVTTRTVDYAGLPCGNQYMYVKAPPCYFPREAQIPVATLQAGTASSH
ncbi:hypothetical protein BJG93_25500 [Paraburkholderia sprentiae WSM5005]|uniref:Lipoprotein n=1 Tax=Paraburkholderia sprentiae WSM5005 TaxID=754502 RepID=A0A1I9YR45_9BURK|nr:hypothetical protein [Paraburkholderia sprentiae]APA88669.1 hypothetical protein BJG93_25500 [Paraburkholderia sprentiae WSM5005]